jgi:DNA-binding FadR family transcriptional regulator
VADQLLQLVLDGDFPVGGSLPSEAELAARFGVSRLTVREAIRSLASTRVIGVQQGRSSVVNPPNQWSPLDGRLLAARSRAESDPLLLPRRLLEARRAVEVAIVELAAERRKDVHVEELQRLHRDLVEAHERGDVVSATEADLAFHAVLFEAADNVFLQALFEPLASALWSVRRETSSVPDIRSHAVTSHQRILDAVVAGDAEAAREAMRAHLVQTEEDFARYLGPGSGDAAHRDGNGAARASAGSAGSAAS